MLMDALDLVERELAEEAEVAARLVARAAGGTGAGGAKGATGPVVVPKRKANPILLGLSPHKYMIRALRQVGGCAGGFVTAPCDGLVRDWWLT